LRHITIVRVCVAVAAASLVCVGNGAAREQRRVGEHGVTVALPAGWHTTPRPLAGLTPSVTDPLTRVVAVSSPFHFDARGCQVAAYAFPRSAVAIVVVEWVQLGRGARWAPRPREFSPGALPLHEPPAIECFDGRGGSVEFADHGRRLGAYLLVGTHARPALVTRARLVLDTLRVSG
jgi:hypothetical protein